ncbi:MAG: hypothetical protein AAFV71_24015 [Cyanobacteria bacterium J06633_8]
MLKHYPQTDIHAFTNRNRVSLSEIEQGAKYVYLYFTANGTFTTVKIYAKNPTVYFPPKLMPNQNRIIGCRETIFQQNLPEDGLSTLRRSRLAVVELI